MRCMTRCVPSRSRSPRPACVRRAQLTLFLDRLQNVIDWDQHTIVGKSQKLEKPYLRLTTVRPSLELAVAIFESR